MTYCQEFIEVLGAWIEARAWEVSRLREGDPNPGRASVACKAAALAALRKLLGMV